MAQHLGVTRIIFGLLKYLLTSSLHSPHCQRAREAPFPDALYSLIHSSILLHPSRCACYWLLTLSSVKASPTCETSKYKSPSTPQFLGLPHCLGFPHRQTTGKNHLKILFLSFLVSHSLTQRPHAGTHLSELRHQRVAQQPCHMIFIWEKDGWSPSLLFFLLQKCCS